MTVRRVQSARRSTNWARWMLQGAVVIAVAASVPTAWSAGGPKGAGAGAGAATGIKVNNVAAGIASITQNGGATTIRTGTRNTIINYQHFSIGSGESLKIIQPSVQSRVLNRIQGSDPSTINGSITSNGRVYIVNPAGVIFGNGAVVNVANLYAAAGHISDSDFMGGVDHFTQNSGLVRNDGVLQAHEIHLVGANVANFGQIITTGENGIVSMTAGKDVYIGQSNSPTGDVSVMVKVSGDGSTPNAGTGVQNSGNIDAGGGGISMGAGDVYAAGIYNNGTLKGRAISLSSHANTNVNEGTIDASNPTGKGGTVQMTGDKVGVFAGTIDASGATGGGTIKIGGDFHGDPGTQAASVTVIGPTAVLKADALANGDGGKIAVWSDDTTRYYGTISARGGPEGGDGGFVEVSGKQDLLFDGFADVTSVFGQNGTILLDPQKITISNGNSLSGTSNNNLVSASNNTVTFTTSATNNATITDARINSLTGDILLQAQTDIEVNNDVNITLQSGASLTLQAKGNIAIDASGGSAGTITASGATGSITLQAAGNILMDSGSKDTQITTGGGNILLSAGDQTITAAAQGTITLNGGSSLASGGGNITFRSTDMAISTSSHGVSAGTGTVAFETNDPTHTIGIGVAGTLSVSPTDLGHLFGGGGNFAKLRFGAAGQQSGAITVVGLIVNNAALELNSDAGAGSVVLSPTGTAISMTGTGNNLTIRAGSGGIVAAGGSANAMITIAGTSHTMNLTSAGGIGTSGARIELANYKGIIGITNSDVSGTKGVFLTSDDTSGLSFTGITNASNPTNIVSAGDINSTGVVSGTTIVLNASGGIGTTAALPISPSTSASLTTGGTGSNGNITILSSVATLNAFTFTTIGGQTITVNRAGDLAITGSFSAPATDVLVVNASGNISASGSTLAAGSVTLKAGLGGTGAIDVSAASITTGGLILLQSGSTGTGNLNVSGGTLTANSITLHAGTGGGTASITLAGATFAGNTLAAPNTLSIEADATIASAPAGGSNTDLTLISHQGNVTIGTDENVKSITAQGGTIFMGGNATVSNSALFTGNLQITQDVTLFGGGGTSNLTVTGTIGSQAGQGFNLTTSFTGATALQGGGDATAGHELGSLTVLNGGGTIVVGSGGTVVFNTTANGSATGSVAINENLSLNGNTTFTATGGSANVIFGGTIDSFSAGSHSTLTINAPGTTWFKADVGGGTRLGGVTTDPAGSTVLGNGGNFNMKVGSPITFNDDVQLNANTTLDATGASSNVTFGKTLLSQANQAWNLTINASGTTAFVGDVGNTATQELGKLSVTNQGGSITLGNGGTFTMKVVNNSSTNGASDGKILLDEPTTIKANTNVTASSDVTFGGVVGSATTSHFGIAITSGGTTLFSAGASTASTSQLGSIVTSGPTNFGGSGTINVITTGSQSYGGIVTLLGNTIFQATALAFNGSPTAISAGSHDLTLISNAMTFNGGTAGSVIGTGNLTLQPLAVGNSIVINATGGTVASTLVIGAGDFAVFTGFASTTIGYAAGTGTITILSAPIFGSATTIQAAGTSGTILVNSPITSNGSLTLHASTITLGANITTDGNALTINGTTTLGASPITLNSAGTTGGGGLVTLIGSIDGAGKILNINTRGTSTAGDIDVQASVGNSGGLAAFNASAGNITIHSNITTAGPINIDASHIFLAHSGTSSTSSIALITAGGVFNTTAPIDTDGSGAVNLAISTSASGATAAAPITLVAVGGGTINQLRNLTLVATDALSDAAITVNAVTLSGSGAFSSAGAAFNGNGVIAAPGGLTLNHSGLVTFSAAVNAGTATVDVTGVGVTNSVLITGGSISLQGGTGGVLLFGSIAGSGPVVLTGTGVGLAAGQTIAGSAVTIDGGSNVVNVLGVVNAGAGGFSSTASGTFDLANTGAINTTDGPVTINHGDAVTISGPIAAGLGTVSITGVGIQVDASSPIAGSAITLIGGSGPISLGSGLTGSGAVSISGTGITQASGATIVGASASLNGGTGTIGLSAPVNASNGFTATASGIFTLNSPGGAINTANGIVSITPGGSVTLNGPIAAGTGKVTVTGAGISTGLGDTITGGTITLNAGSQPITLLAAVTGTGPSSPVSISGKGITQGASATITGSAATLNGGTGAISLSSPVIAPGGFSATTTSTFDLTAGSITTSGNILSITPTGSVTLAAPLIAGAGRVIVTGAGFSNTAAATITGGSITIDGGSQLTSINGVVNGSGPLSISGTTVVSTVALTGSTVALNGRTGSVSLAGAVTGPGGVTSTASGAFLLVPAAGSIQTTDSNVTINHGGAITLNGNISAGAGTVSLHGAGVDQIGGAITAGKLLLGGNGDFLLAQSNSVSNVSAAVSGNLNLTTGGALAVGSMSASTVTLTASTVTGGNITVTPATLTVNGNVSFSSPVTAAGLITITGDATINSPLVSSGGGINISGNAGGSSSLSSAGSMSIGGALTATGAATAGGYLHVGGLVSITSSAPLKSGGSMNLDSTVAVNGSLQPTGVLTIGSTSTVGGNVNGGAATNFGGNSTITGNFLSGGAATFTGDAVLNSGTVTGALTVGGNLSGATLRASGLTHVTGNTIITNSLTTGDLHLNTLTLNGTITSAAAALVDGAAIVNGLVSAAGNITFGSTLAINSTLTAGGNISITEPMTLPNAVSNTVLTAHGGTGITVGAISGSHSIVFTTTGTTARTSVGAIGSSSTPLGGDVDFRSNAAVTLNGVELHGNIFARNVTFEDTVGDLTTQRLDVPRVATVVGRGDLVIEAAQKITMEKNQKLTVLGSLSLTASTLTLGDIGALGTIILDARSLNGPIIFLQRAAQTEVGATAADGGTDIISYSTTTLTPNTIATGFPAVGTTIGMRGDVSAVGGTLGQRLQFSSITAAVDLPPDLTSVLRFEPGTDPSLAGKAPVLPRILTTTFNVSDQLGVSKAVQNLAPADLAAGDAVTGTARDLVAGGITGNSPQATQGSIIPRDVQTLVPDQVTGITGAMKDTLREAGINARDTRLEEIIDDLIRRAVYDDVPYELDPQPKDYQVAVNRLPLAPIAPVIVKTRELLFTAALDDKGNPIYENEKPKLVSQADAVSKAIGEAWQLFKDDTTASGKASDFRAYLEAHEDNPKFAKGLGYLNQLRDLLAMIQNLGLTPKEFEVSKNVLLAKLRFVETVSEEDFPVMVDSPSSRGPNAVKTAVNTPAEPPKAAQ